MEDSACFELDQNQPHGMHNDAQPPEPHPSSVPPQQPPEQPNYPVQPTWPTSFSAVAQNPQVNFMYQNTPPYSQQNPQSQPFQTHQPPPTRPAPYPPQCQPDPMPPNGSNVGQLFPAQKASYPPQPATFQQAHNGGQAGFAPMPPTFPNGVQSGIPVPNLDSTQWRTDLFDCMDDPMNAVIILLCPCVTFGEIAEIIGNDGTSCATSGMLYCLIAFLIGCPCIMSCTYRTKLRNKFGLLESPLPDWLAHCLCEYCAICQEYRELKARGLDPSIGWQGNVARQMQQVNMMPPMHQRMV